ncbi:PucR family transcriptional regulator [Nocardia takedensis]
MTNSALDLSAELPDAALEIGGFRASVSLRNTDRVASRMVGYFDSRTNACPGATGEQLRGDVTRLTENCLALAAEMFDRRAVPGAERFGEIRDAASRWARQSVPLGAVLSAYHEGLRIAFGMVTAHAGAEDVREVMAATDLLLALLAAITAEISEVYLDEQQVADREHQTAAQTVASALLGGRGAEAPARQAGIPIAAAYQVVALAVAEHPDETDPRADPTVVARRTLRRLQSRLASALESRALALLSPEGGTLLIPADGDGPLLTPEILTLLSEAAQVPLRAAVVDSVTDEVPAAARQAHELLGLVQVGARGPGLYRMADLAVEYQLTRGGPAGHRIATVLDPLDDHPELFATMRAYLGNDMNRRLTARQLYVHPNTVDYRLRRIAQLTPIDLATSAGISQAAIALLARDLERGVPDRS